jgi:outer membrane receptor protein involved in Fe transport
VFWCCATPATAQSSPGASGASSGGIEEVVVTATRRSEVLSKVPVSVSAFTADKMEQLNVKNVTDLIKFTPGLNYDDRSHDISIRGVNSNAGDATTGIYIDDTPIQLRALGFGSDNTLPAVFDLARVEVLRGPQGTLFGAGSEGGTIRFITPTPSLTEFSGYARSEVSFTQDGSPNYEFGAAAGGPIVDNQLGFRVSAWARHDGGWIDKVDYMTGARIQANTNSVGTFVTRGSLLWQPMQNLAITPSIYFQNRNQNNLDQYWVGISDPNSGVFKTGTPENMADKDHFLLPALKIDYDMGGVELISDTSYFYRHEHVQDYSGTLYDLSYFQRSVDFGLTPGGTPCTGGLCLFYEGVANPPPLLTPTGIDLPGYGTTPAFGHYYAVNNITNEQKNITQELRLQSTDPNARLIWTVGAFYTHQSQLSVEEINDPQLPALTQYLWGDTMQNIWGEELLPNGDDYINHTLGHDEQLALYANATYAIIDQLKLQAGIRVAKTHFDFTNFSDGAQNFGPLGPTSGKKNEVPVTPMGDVTWQITPDDMVYFTVAKGYRIGGANPQFPVSACTEITSEPISYDSDTVLSYEVGSKDRFLNDSFQTSASLYYLEWSNIQQPVLLPSCGFRYVTNQGAAVSKGFDLQGEWLVTDALDIDFTLGYVDAYYTQTSESAGLILAEKGDKLPGSPWTLSFGAQYNTQVMGNDSYFRLDYEFSSAETGLTPSRDPATTLFDPALLPEPQTNQLSLRAGMTLSEIDLALFAENLLNAHPQLDLNHQDNKTLLLEASTLRPRTIGISATYHY